MRKHHMPEMKEGGVNVTPLIDIVMCLIIFFMLVAKIGVSTGADSTIEPPSTLLGKDIKDMGNTLTVNVRGGPRLDEPIVTALVDGQKKEIKIVEQRGATRDKPLLRVFQALRKGNEEFKVIILGEKDLEFHLLEQVLMTAAEAGVKSVNVQTKKASIIEKAQENAAG